MASSRERSEERGPARSLREERLKLEVATGERASGVVPCGRPEAQEQTQTPPGDTRGDRDTTRELVMLAWPIATAMLGETAMGLVDTKLVGGLGPAALGGVGLATVLVFVTYSFVFGLQRGVKVRSSHAYGQSRDRDTFAYAKTGLAFGFGFGALVLAACRDVEPLLVRLGIEASIVPFARDFLAAVTLGAPAICAYAALVHHRHAIGDSRTPMLVGLGGNAVNAALAWSLIYGHLGLPALGARGAGYATALTQWLLLLTLLALFVRDEERLAPEPRVIGLRKAARGVFGMGAPIGAQYLAETLAFASFTAVLGSIGPEEIAANQIAFNLMRVSSLPGLAVAEAGSVLVGRALGARDLALADRVTKSALSVAVAFMAACGVAFALGGGRVGSLFTADAGVRAVTTRLLLVAAVFQVLDAVNLVLRCALRGAKDVRAVAVFGVVVVWSFVPTSAYALGKLCGMGALGGWLGFVGSTFVGALVFWVRWRRGAWRAAYRVASRDQRRH